MKHPVHDFYQITMGSVLYDENLASQKVLFDYFFRHSLKDCEVHIFAGLENLFEILLDNPFFIDLPLNQFKNLNPKFLKKLETLQFQGEIYSLEEGEVFFSNLPAIRVEATLLEALVIEDFLLEIINCQTTVASHSFQFLKEAKGKSVFDFSPRRVSGMEASYMVSRAAFIGGITQTSHFPFALKNQSQSVGTMSHSYVMAFETEKEAFFSYASHFPSYCIFILDTYDAYIAIDHAIEVFVGMSYQEGDLWGVRLDSGDLKQMSQFIRHRLNAHHLQQVKIFVTNHLNHQSIQELALEPSIDGFGIGTSLVYNQNELGIDGVYKMVGVFDQDETIIPKIKISNDSTKQTIPGRKNILRFYSKNKMILCDLLFLCEEQEEIIKEVETFHKIEVIDFLTHQDIKIEGYVEWKILLELRVSKGKKIHQNPSLKLIQEKTIQHSTSHPKFFKAMTKKTFQLILKTQSQYIL